jgi:hypothetical protein
MQRSKIKDQRLHGVVALATVLLLGAVLTEIALAGIFIVSVLNNSSMGLRSAAAALAAAQSGIDDALLNVVRDKDYLYSPSPFVLSVASARATITVTNPPCGASLVAKPVIIMSLGSAGLGRRHLRTDVVVDCLTGEVRVVSSQEVPVS